MSNKIKNEQKQLTALQSSYPLQFPERLYRPFTEKLIGLEGRLTRSGQDITKRDQSELIRLTGMLSSLSPMQDVNEQKREVIALTNRLTRTVQHDFRMHSERFSSSVRMLKALNPLDIMERGYSIVYQKGNVTNSVNSLDIGAEVQIQLQDGTANATINSVSHDEEEER